MASAMVRGGGVVESILTTGGTSFAAVVVMMMKSAVEELGGIQAADGIPRISFPLFRIPGRRVAGSGFVLRG